MALIKYTPYWYCLRCTEEWGYEVVRNIQRNTVAIEKHNCEACGYHGLCFFIHEAHVPNRPAIPKQLADKQRELPAAPITIHLPPV